MVQGHPEVLQHPVQLEEKYAWLVCYYILYDCYGQQPLDTIESAADDTYDVGYLHALPWVQPRL